MKRLSMFIYLAILCIFLCGVEAHVIANIPNSTTPPPPGLLPIKVQSHKVKTEIKNGVAVTTHESVFYNPNYQVLEGMYLFALPKGASVSQFSLWIDGKEMPAELLDADKARDLYISIVRRMVDPALLEYVGRETFKMRIFPLPAQGNRQIKLTYEQLLPVDGNLMRYEYPLTIVGNGHEDTLGEFSLTIQISSQIPLKAIFSPTHKIEIVKEENRATVTFAGNQVPTDKDFVLYLSMSDKDVDLSFIPFRKGEEDGYFLVMLAPKTKVDASDINPKDIVFVLDTSGSMVGAKMEQAKRALKYCLHQLGPKDNFNIIPFSTEANPYRDNLIPASPDNVKAALQYVENDIFARGGTNIAEALNYAMQMASKSAERPYMVIFLTDGKPTIGIVDTEEIIKMVQKANLGNLRLFTFGIGEELNTQLLDRLAEENRGVREYVGSKEDIEIKVSNFVDKISSPVLSNIKIHFPSAEGLRVSEVYPREFPDIFKGARLTILGRYKGAGDQAIRVTGILGGKTQEFVYEATFPTENLENVHIPRLWAVRKVGYLIDQIRLHGESDELKKEVVELAKKFAIVTPYTSYLVVEDTPVVVRPPEGPMPVVTPGVWEESRREAAASPEGEVVAGDEYKKKSGKKAIQASKDVRDMKETEGVYENEETKSEQTMVRKIDYKTFYKQGDVWYDSDCQTEAAKKLPKVRIRYLGDEYLKLLTDNPEIGKFLSIGPRVVLVWKDKIYEVYEE